MKCVQTRFGYTLRSMCRLEIMSFFAENVYILINRVFVIVLYLNTKYMKVLQKYGRCDIKSVKISEKSIPALLHM